MQTAETGSTTSKSYIPYHMYIKPALGTCALRSFVQLTIILKRISSQCFPVFRKKLCRRFATRDDDDREISRPENDSDEMMRCDKRG